jgi:hypothetical protein
MRSGGVALTALKSKAGGSSLLASSHFEFSFFMFENAASVQSNTLQFCDPIFEAGASSLRSLAADGG